MGGVVHGDFGSTITGQPIADELTSRIGVSLRLFTLGAMLPFTGEDQPPSHPARANGG